MYGLWSSGTRYGNGEDYYWFGDDEKMIFTGWADGEPNNNYGYEPCLKLLKYYGWNDQHELENYHAVCEY